MLPATQAQLMAQLKQLVQLSGPEQVAASRPAARPMTPDGFTTPVRARGGHHMGKATAAFFDDIVDSLY